MTPTTNQIVDFANRHLEPYKINNRSREISPLYCPICHGGGNRDKHTFFLNIDSGLACCKRGSCEWKGTIAMLADKFGEDPSQYGGQAYNRKKKVFVKPEIQLNPRTDVINHYFDQRGISESTLDKYNIAADDNGNVIFPFYEGDTMVFVKYRKPIIPSPHKMKEWQEPDTKPVLFGMQTCSFDKPLVICEGEIDALSCSEAGIDNVVSVPCGCDDLYWVELCWDWLEQFKTIVLFGDNDVPGRKMVDQLVKRFGEDRCKVVKSYPDKSDGIPCKDPNEILTECGDLELIESFESAEDIPVKGIIQLADVVPIDVTTIPRIQIGIPKLDEALGGLALGAITVFTGMPGDGKSTLTGLIALNAIEQGYNVCAYSGELSKEQFESWILYQAAGSDYITLKYDAIKDKDVPVVDYAAKVRILDHIRDHFFLFDNNEIFESNQTEAILQAFTMVARKYGVKLFFVDNLLTALSDSDEETKAQGRFMAALKRFALRYDVHVVVVAHAKKTKNGEKIGQNDISGNSATSKLAHNAVVVERPNLRVIKSRDTGFQGIIECVYCPDSRRIYQADAGDRYNFTWDKEGLTKPSVLACDNPEYAPKMANNDLF